MIHGHPLLVSGSLIVRIMELISTINLPMYNYVEVHISSPNAYHMFSKKMCIHNHESGALPLEMLGKKPHLQYFPTHVCGFASAFDFRSTVA